MFQKLSISFSLHVGKLFNLKTFYVNNSMTFGASTISLVAMKWAILLRWSTITKIVSFYRGVCGNPMIKSMDILCQVDSRICKGWSNLGLLTLPTLIAWSWKHYWTYLWTSFSRWGHQNASLTSLMVLSRRGCLAYWLSWWPCKTFTHSFCAQGT